jgi:hypothetical protein
MAWHKVAESGHIEILENLRDWAKELHLKPEELKNEVLSKSRFLKMSLSMASEPLVHFETTKRKAHLSPSKSYSLTSHTSQPLASNSNEVSEFHSDLYSAVTGKDSASTVLSPFSGELTVDTKQNLSHDDFE